jgi:ligand-binding SRPBCC domain-containing protein
MWFRIETKMLASPKAVFDASRDIGLHLENGKAHGERVVEGRTSGLMQKGETVTWEAKHLGIKQTMTVQMEEAIDPTLIITRMLRGPFAYFVHYHRIIPFENGTLLVDEVSAAAPLGILGYLVEQGILKKHLYALIVSRNKDLKSYVEGQ